MKRLLSVLFAGMVAGLVSPFIASSLVAAIHALNVFWGHYIFLAPAIGFWIVGIFTNYSSLILGTGVNSYKDENVRIKIKDLGFKYISTIVTLGFGGSGGLVSPILFIGKGISEIFAKKGERTFSIALAAGMLTFYLGTPLSAAFLAVEYFEKDQVGYEDLMPAVLASIVSYYHHTVLGFYPLLSGKLVITEKLGEIGFFDLFLFLVLAAIAGGLGMTAYFLKWVYRKAVESIPNAYKFLFSGLMVSFVGLLFGKDVLGLKIIFGKDVSKFIAGKILATVFTIESMGSCGYFTPLTVIGMNLGYLFQHFGINQGVGSVIGISALLSSMLNVPVAAVIFPVELFGFQALIPAAIGSSAAYLIYKRFRLE